MTIIYVICSRKYLIASAYSPRTCLEVLNCVKELQVQNGGPSSGQVENQAFALQMACIFKRRGSYVYSGKSLNMVQLLQRYMFCLEI